MPEGISIAGLFLEADPIVKAVMVLLLLASVGCWGLALEKLVTIGRLKRAARLLHACVAAGAWERADAAGPTRPIVEAGLAQWRAPDASESRAELRNRIERAMRAAAANAVRSRETGLPFLATIGSAAPFVGLFGTVWGIMGSFTAIAETQDTSLAVVAPGIAEALFATAIGLVAAIPAVMAYNKFATDLRRVSQLFGSAIATIAETLSADRAAASRKAAE